VADAGVELVDPSILLKGGEQATFLRHPDLALTTVTLACTTMSVAAPVHHQGASNRHSP
jgi:hypothetical protein